MEKTSNETHSQPWTLRNLLDLTRANFPNNPTLSVRYLEHYMARFENTAKYMARSIGMKIDTASVSSIAEAEAEFTHFLEELDRKENTVSRHMGRRDALLSYAKDFGLLPLASPIEQEWAPVLNAAGRKISLIRPIVEYAKGKSLHTFNFTQSHMDAWCAQAKSEGRLEDYSKRAEKAFRRTIRKGKLEAIFPAFDSSKHVRPYSVYIENMDPLLQANVLIYVAWARSQAASKTLRIGESIVTQFEALCGYAIIIRKMKGIDCIDPLLARGFLEEYVDWLHDDRGCKLPAIFNRLGGIHTLVFHHPHFQNQDFSWWTGLFDRVEPELESAIKERREDQLLPYEDLLAILPKMREYRLSATNLSPAAMRRLVRDELLMTIAIKLLWDPQTIRIARHGGTSPNVLKDRVPKGRPNLAFTPSARKAYRENSDADLWQFNFVEERGVEAFGFMIDDALSLLEDYARDRSDMIGNGPDPGTLFFTRTLKPLSRVDLCAIVGKYTDKFAKKRVTPESIRNSFIDYWLIEYPKAYLALSNILWVSLESIQIRFDPEYRKPEFRGR